MKKQDIAAKKLFDGTEEISQKIKGDFGFKNIIINISEFYENSLHSLGKIIGHTDFIQLINHVNFIKKLVI